MSDPSNQAAKQLVRDQIKTVPVTTRSLPDMRVRSLSDFASSARQRALTIEIQRAPHSGPERLERIIDIFVAALALIFFLPLMAVISIAIKLDGPGPVILRQNRKGFNGRQFVIFEFRTMRVQENGPAAAQSDNPQVTAIGRLLRSASIDELPRLLNVLKGDMSLIGPLPRALAHDSFLENVKRATEIRLAPTLTDQIPWQILSERTQDAADVLDRQDLNETLDRTISAIELNAPPPGSRWAPTSTKTVRYGHAINTILKAVVGAFCGLVLLGYGWLMIMTILNAS